MIDYNEFWNKYKSCDVYAITELPAEIQKGIELAKEASKNAYAPYSNYSVGAVIVTESGNAISSNNAEICNYDAVCAEAGAISEWIKQKREKISFIVTFGKPGNAEKLRDDVFVTPCGRCRQRIYEHCSDNTIVISSNETGNKVRVFKLSSLLPFAFTPMNLK